MSLLPFIDSLVEARMFYGVKDIKGMSADEIAQIVFLMFMMLEVIRHYKPNYTADYARDTLKYNTYDNLHYSGSDLGNLIAVLNNQDTFEKDIKPHTGVSIPLFQINRYLGQLTSKATSKSAHNDDVTFFWRLEDYLKLSGQSLLRQLRRDIGNWNDLHLADKQQIYLILRREFDKRCSSVDMYLWYKSSFKITESAINEVKRYTALDTRGDLPPQGEILASYTDDDGYTVSIRGGVAAGKEIALGQRRYGQFIITSPKGKSVNAGFWMAWPEDEWWISKPMWEGMSWQQRAEIEVKHQATAYKSLADQFKSRINDGEFVDRLGEPAMEESLIEEQETERLDITEKGDWNVRVFLDAHLTNSAKNWIDRIGEGKVNRATATLDLDNGSGIAYINRIDATPTGEGFGSELLKYIVEQAKAHGYYTVKAYTEWTNVGSKDMFKKAGFKSVNHNDSGNYWELDL